MQKFLVSLLFAALSAAALPARADEANVKKAVEAWLGGKVEGVRKAGILGLYEVNLGGEILYTDEKVSTIINGELIDGKTRRNLTRERLAKLMTIDFSALPLEHAVKIVRGNGKRTLATFEDPNCSYCKRMVKEMQAMTDVTIYTFLMPILSQDSVDKARNIWCSADRAKAWTDWMIGNVGPAVAQASCTAPTDKVVALGKKLGIRGTPTLFLSSGERIPGAVPLARLEQAMEAAAN